VSDPSIKHGPNGEAPALGYDAATNHALVALQVANVFQDTVTNQWYGMLSVSAQNVAQAGYVALSTAPTQTTANTDTTYIFGSQVNTVLIQNNTTANLNYAFDAAATAGSLVLLPGQYFEKPKKVTSVHLLTALATNVNGTAANNIVLLGEL
jgi:hypothetical protein